MSEANIAVRVGAKVDQFKSDMESAGRSLDKFSKEAKRGAKDVAKYGAAAVTAGAAIATHLVKHSLEAIDAQAKLSKQIGTTFKEVESLTRAGSLAGVSLQQITNASLKLEINAGKAEQGLMAQKRAFDAMGLSAKEVMKLPLSERILTINKALNENVEETQRAAVASDIFGAKNASTIRLLDPETIKRAAEETKLYGTALSEIDAAKVEDANDSIARIGLAAEGAAEQFTVQLAPILRAIGDLFEENMKEAGGMGNAIKDAFNTAIDIAGFVADAVDGVQRAFELTADGIILATEGLKGGFVAAITEIAKAADMIPGVDMSESIAELEQFGSDSVLIIEQTKAHMDEILMRPLPSEGFKTFVEDARKAGEEAAIAMVEAREAKLIESNEKARESHLKYLDDEIFSEFEKDAAITDNYLAEIDRRNEATQKEHQARMNAASNALGDLSSLMSSENKKQFEIGKKASLAQAAISTIEGAQNAYTSLASIPYIGPALGIAAAAAAIVAGNARMAQIKSQTFGGSGSVSSSGGGSVAASSPSAAAAPQRNITLSGITPDQFVKSGTLIDALNKELADGGNLNIEFA